MSLNSLLFILFVVLAVTVYYLIPGKYQWCWLLAASYMYYLANSRGLVIFLIAATVTTFFGARLIEREADDKRRRLIMLAVLTTLQSAREGLSVRLFADLSTLASLDDDPGVCFPRKGASWAKRPRLPQ